MGYSWYKTSRPRKTRGYKLARPMGFEFTFERRYQPENVSHYEAINKLAKLGIHSYDDDSCLEVNSPVFQYSEDPIYFWRRLREILGWRYVTRSPQSTGGGTHIHVGVANEVGKTFSASMTSDADQRSDWWKFAVALMNVTRNRPWLAWGMQDPTYEINGEDYGNAIFTHEPNSPFQSGLQGTYNDQLWSFGTIELRFFDTADSEADLRAYIKTAQVLCKLALRKETERPRERMTYAQAARYLRSGGALKAFRRFLAENNIEHTDFKLRQFAAWFCDENLPRTARLAA